MSVVTCSSSHKRNVAAPWPGHGVGLCLLLLVAVGLCLLLLVAPLLCSPQQARSRRPLHHC
jgi:hypothetical protein